jgi:hypothetical protein
MDRAISQCRLSENTTRGAAQGLGQAGKGRGQGLEMGLLSGTGRPGQLRGSMLSVDDSTDYSHRAPSSPTMSAKFDATALDALEKRVADVNIAAHASTTGETTREWLTRFLVARDGNVDRAEAMVREDDLWRRESFLAEPPPGMSSRDVSGLAFAHTDGVLGCPASLLDRYFDGWQQGVDRKGQPVVYKKYGVLEVSSMIAAGASVSSLVRYHVAEQERLSLALRAASVASGKRISSATFVIDAAGWHVALATPDAMRFLRAIADIDQVSGCQCLRLLRAPLPLHLTPTSGAAGALPGATRPPRVCERASCALRSLCGHCDLAGPRYTGQGESMRSLRPGCPPLHGPR